MSNFHIVVIFNDYYTLIVAFLTKQIQNRYRNRRFPNTQDQLRQTDSGQIATFFTLTAPDRCFYLVEPGLLHNVYNRSEKGEDQ